MIYPSPYHVKLPDYRAFERDVKRNIHKPYPELIRSVTGYDTLLVKEHKAGAYCNIWNDVIGLKRWADLDVVLHEMAHAWQAGNGIDFYQDKLLSRQVEVEQQADAMSKQIIKSIFGIELDKKYWSYFSKSSIKWLAEYYDGFIENDLNL